MASDVPRSDPVGVKSDEEYHKSNGDLEWDLTVDPPCHRKENQHVQDELLAKDEENEALIDRIQACVSYVQACYARGQRPPTTSYFTISITRPPSKALTLVRQAAHDGHAETIFTSPHQERYSLGVPRKPDTFHGLDPQWWQNKSRAEIRAGPWAERPSINKAQGEVKRTLMRREHSAKMAKGKLRQARKRVEEGLRRQELRLPVRDEDKSWSSNHEDTTLRLRRQGGVGGKGTDWIVEGRAQGPTLLRGARSWVGLGDGFAISDKNDGFRKQRRGCEDGRDLVCVPGQE